MICACMICVYDLLYAFILNTICQVCYTPQGLQVLVKALAQYGAKTLPASLVEGAPPFAFGIPTPKTSQHQLNEKSIKIPQKGPKVSFQAGLGFLLVEELHATCWHSRRTKLPVS